MPGCRLSLIDPGGERGELKKAAPVIPGAGPDQGGYVQGWRSRRDARPVPFELIRISLEGPGQTGPQLHDRGMVLAFISGPVSRSAPVPGHYARPWRSGGPGKLQGRGLISDKR